MQTSVEEKFQVLVDLIKEVKPGLGDRPVQAEDSVVEQLGLDSLDILQLSRKIRRSMGAGFDLDAWDAEVDKHNRSVQSILDSLESGA